MDNRRPSSCNTGGSPPASTFDFHLVFIILSLFVNRLLAQVWWLWTTQLKKGKHPHHHQALWRSVSLRRPCSSSNGKVCFGNCFVYTVFAASSFVFLVLPLLELSHKNVKFEIKKQTARRSRRRRRSMLVLRRRQQGWWSMSNAVSSSRRMQSWRCIRGILCLTSEAVMWDCDVDCDVRLDALLSPRRAPPVTQEARPQFACTVAAVCMRDI